MDIMCRMNLKDYLRQLGSDDARDAFAQACGTSLNYLKLIAYGAKRAGAATAINIDRASNGTVRCEDLRPDIDWAYLRSRPLPPDDS